MACTKTEFLEVPVEVKVEDSLVFNLHKDGLGSFGAEGFINSERKTYKEVQYSFYVRNDEELLGLIIDSLEWIGNTFWANRQRVSVNDINPFQIIDTIKLKPLSLSQEMEPRAGIFHSYLDGDVGAECYRILENSESWLLFTEYNEEAGVLEGQIHADFVISENCPPKYDPSQPDTIIVRDLRFRAGLRE